MDIQTTIYFDENLFDNVSSILHYINKSSIYNFTDEKIVKFYSTDLKGIGIYSTYNDVYSEKYGGFLKLSNLVISVDLYSKLRYILSILNNS